VTMVLVYVGIVIAVAGVPANLLANLLFKPTPEAPDA
jgi:hypothetical protein